MEETNTTRISEIAPEELEENSTNPIPSEEKAPEKFSSKFDIAVISKVVAILCIALSCFHIYTAGFGTLPTTLQRAWHLTFILTLIFLLYPSKSKWFRCLDYFLSAAGAASGLYIVLSYNTLVYRVGNPNLVDIIFGCVLCLLVLEATRRTSGWALVIVSLVAVLYTAFGHLIPGDFGHRQYTLVRIVNTFYVGGEGLFGSTMGVAATYIVTFCIFGAFLAESGGTKVFMDLAYAVAGRFRGGPAKIAVISSALMGTINGTATANVVTTGTFTIPLMKKMGYKPETAGAVEAVASSGGAIMPPVMGAGAFIMSELTGIPYSRIIIAALIPAVIYYISIFFSVDFEACKLHLRGIPKEELPKLGPALRKSLAFFVPLLTLIFFICIQKKSVLRSAFYALIAIIACNLIFGGENRMKPKQYLKALISGAKGTLMVSMACCCVGLVVGTISLTGLGLKLTSLLLAIAGNSQLLALLMVMLITIIMGMALPATPAYIIVAVIACTAMEAFGIEKLIAHLFVYYFCVFAPITPPVCIASYAAASIAKSNPMKTGVTGMRLAIAGFLCPFMMVYSPALTCIGSAGEVVLAAATACLGAIAFSAFAIGWFRSNLTVVSRILCLVAGAFMLIQGIYSDIIGFAILAFIYLIPEKVSLFKAPPIPEAELKIAS